MLKAIFLINSLSHIQSNVTRTKLVLHAIFCRNKVSVFLTGDVPLCAKSTVSK